MNLISLNDLFDYKYKIYQNDDYFKFSIDSVLLAEFVSVKKNKNKLLDICSGNFPVPMILDEKFDGKLEISAVELQEDVFKLGVESLNYNKIVNIKSFNDDNKNYKKIYNNKKFDIITCNPPYFVVTDDKVKNDNSIKAIARHEIALTLEDVFYISSKLLENQGSLYMIHKGERLADIILFAAKYKFGIKKIQPVYDSKDSPCCFVLVEAVFNAKNYVKIGNPLFLKDYSSYKGIFER